MIEHLFLGAVVVVLVFYGYLHYKQKLTNKQILADAVSGLTKIADNAKGEFTAIKADVARLKTKIETPSPLPPAAPPPPPDS